MKNATAKFVEDIPMNKNHISWKTLKNVEDNLHTIKGKKLILWGAKDFCFNMSFLSKWREIFPDDKVVVYENAGHYVIEDERENCIKEIKGFLNEYSCTN